MPLPPPISASRQAFPPPVRLGLAVVLLLFLAAPAHARGPDPPQRIPLEPFGFQSISSRYLLEGASMLTLDYVDGQHLLVTFGVSRLMPRLADCPPDDEDRTVRAVLIELPTGREIARTEWRFHDLGQYLWNLGDGQFLLRKRDALTVIAPVQNFVSGQSFAEQPFLHFDRRIAAILVSANNDLLSIETIKRVPPGTPVDAVSQTAAPPSQSSASPPPVHNTGLQRRDPNAPKPDPEPTPTPAPVRVDFLRIMRVPIPGKVPPSGKTPPTPAAPVPVRLVGRLDGRIYTANAVNVPLTAAGFLRSRATTHDGVLLDFITFAGKDIDLGDFTTSCTPRPTFISPSEFVAFGCRGDAQSLDLAGFNLKGDFLWQINFTDEQAYPAFASALPAGRFAFSRTVTSTHVFGNETPSMEQLQAQEVRVIQMYSGKQLLRVVTSPIQRVGQNFTLSPDGLALAVIHDNPTARFDDVIHHTSIEIYALPPVSERDRAQIKLEAAIAPEPTDGHMRFSPEQIQAALREKQDTSVSNEYQPQTPADSQIVGDPAPPTAPSTGTIPSSDAAPACATLTEANSTPATGCPVTRPAAKAAASTDSTPEFAPDKPRKPPTLYEPATENPPANPPR